MHKVSEIIVKKLIHPDDGNLVFTEVCLPFMSCQMQRNIPKKDKAVPKKGTLVNVNIGLPFRE